MLSIRNKLHLGFALILLFILGQTVITYLYLNQSQALVNEAIGKDFSASVDIARIGIEAQKLRRFEKEFLIYVGSASQRSKYLAEWRASYTQIGSMLGRIVENREGRWSPADITRAREWQKSLNAYGDGFLGVGAAAASGQITNTMQGNEAVAEAKNAFRILLDGTAAAIELKYQSADNTAQTINGKFRLVNSVLLVAALAGVVLVVTMLFVVPASIARPIETLTRAAHDMSTGNLGKSVAVSGSPEFKELGETLERMRISQQMLMERIKSKMSAG